MISLAMIQDRREDGEDTFYRETMLKIVIYAIDYQLLSYRKHPTETSLRC